MASWLFRITGVVSPCIDSRRFRMAMYQKDFDGSIPNRFALEYLFDRHALQVGGLYAMHAANCVLQVGNIAHGVAVYEAPLRFQVAQFSRLPRSLQP